MSDNRRDLLDDLLDYEEGKLDDDAVIALFQQLVNTGLAWELQGSYGRTASMLILQGHVHRPAQEASPDEADRARLLSATPPLTGEGRG